MPCVQGSPGSKAAFEALTRPAVHVATTQLRDALNEHVSALLACLKLNSTAPVDGCADVHL